MLALCLVSIKYLIVEWKRNVVFPVLLVAKACETSVNFPQRHVLTSTAKPLKNYKFFLLSGQCFHLFWKFSFALDKTLAFKRRVQVTLKTRKFRVTKLRFSLYFLSPEKICCRWRVLAWMLKTAQVSWDVSPATLRAQAVHAVPRGGLGNQWSLGSCELSNKNLLVINESNRLLLLRSTAGKKKVHGISFPQNYWCL